MVLAILYHSHEEQSQSQHQDEIERQSEIIALQWEEEVFSRVSFFNSGQCDIRTLVAVTSAICAPFQVYYFY